MSHLKRILKELSSIEESNSNIEISVIDKNIQKLRCTLIPSTDSIYYIMIDDKQITYNLDITIGDEYPFVPPKVVFSPPIYHPNVFAVSGDICLDILKDAWTPALTIKHIGLSILSLLNSPNTNDPVNALAADLFNNDKNKYKNEIKSWHIKKNT